MAASSNKKKEDGLSEGVIVALLALVPVAIEAVKSAYGTASKAHPFTRESCRARVAGVDGTLGLSKGAWCTVWFNSDEGKVTKLLVGKKSECESMYEELKRQHGAA